MSASEGFVIIFCAHAKVEVPQAENLPQKGSPQMSNLFIEMITEALH